MYPTIPEGIRDVNTARWSNIEESFNKKDNQALVKELLKLDLFPIKDSYIAYLKRDPSSIEVILIPLTGFADDSTKWV